MSDAGRARRRGPRRREAGRLLAGIRALVRRFSVSERADTSCCGMTIAQAATLEALGTSGPMTLGTLSRRLGVSPSTLTRNLARLEERALVGRRSHPRDGRAFEVALTGRGRKAAILLDRRDEEFARSVLDRLPAQRARRALQGLNDLLAAVRGATESCCPGAFDHLMQDFPRARAGATRRTR